MNPYILKRKDENIAIVNMTEEGSILNYQLYHENMELAPLHNISNHDWLKSWWSRRAVPIEQKHIKEMLEKKGLLSTEDYLLKNLGLSLTDYYWISPIDSNLKWSDVNLFENDFHDDINIANDEENDEINIPHYTPNGSLQGSLEKCWTIRNGKRGMLKGNRDVFSSESMNEVIASKLHELQGFAEYTPYKLVEIHGRDYKYGCYSELFASTQLELISAYDVVDSVKKRQDVNTFEHFIDICSAHGLPEKRLRPFLEYQIMTDFILSNRDRHLSNISILRDADTLEFIKPAPIYDTGRSLFVNDTVPDNETDMLKIQTASWASNELKLLELVRDRSLVDVSKLPDPSVIEMVYSLDPQMTDSRINAIKKGYECKVELFRKWQNGEDIKKMMVARYRKVKTDLADWIIS